MVRINGEEYDDMNQRWRCRLGHVAIYIVPAEGPYCLANGGCGVRLIERVPDSTPLTDPDEGG